MNEIKVSIILPSLNVGRYIQECLESVVHQTLREIEIICVDAGSTDGTVDIIKKYAEKDGRILFLSSEKKSYGYQMNMGMNAAHGEYIGIVETDDYVDTHMFQDLYEAAEKNHADFVRSDFYRFTTNSDGSLEKTLFPLSSDKKYYNRIIDISEEQVCFDFPMNIWSGIYNRSFIFQHGIRYNESAGAAFQDNGFWFQTMVHAHNAYFLENAYYMNRRDNPNSSVYDTSKVYEICGEYQFILKNLEKDQELYQVFKNRYVIHLLRNYLWTLERICYRDKPGFYQRMQKDLAYLMERGMVDYREIAKCSEWMVFDVYEIMYHPKHWYQRVFGLTKRIIEELGHEREIYLYGAGDIGKKCCDELLREGFQDKLRGFLVSKKSPSEKNYKGIPIIEFSEIDTETQAAILVTVSPKHKKEIYPQLREIRLAHIIPWPDRTYIRITETRLSRLRYEHEPSQEFVFPYERVEKGSRIVLYGEGELEKSYYRQIEHTGYATIVNRIAHGEPPSDCVWNLQHGKDYDYIVLALWDSTKKSVCYDFLSKRIPLEKIVWSSILPDSGKSKNNTTSLPAENNGITICGTENWDSIVDHLCNAQGIECIRLYLADTDVLSETQMDKIKKHSIDVGVHVKKPSEHTLSIMGQLAENKIKYMIVYEDPCPEKFS